MNLATPLLVPVLAFLLSFSGDATVTDAAEGPDATASSPRVTGPVVLTPDHAGLIEWAIDLYESAGLDLDGIAVGVHDDQTVCGEGRRGFYIDRIVTVCATNDRAATQEAWRRHTLLHELAHAWMDLHLGAGARGRFMEARGVESWDDRDHAWHERGAEHAAEIMAWALADYPIYPHVRLRDRTCDSLRIGYEMLTDSRTPRGFDDHCD